MADPDHMSLEDLLIEQRVRGTASMSRFSFSLTGAALSCARHPIELKCLAGRTESAGERERERERERDVLLRPAAARESRAARR